MIIVSVAPKPPTQGGGLKDANRRFWFKITLRLKKVCYKVCLCENCQRQSCKVKIIGGSDPRARLLEIVGQTDRLGAKSHICDLFSFVAPQP